MNNIDVYGQDNSEDHLCAVSTADEIINSGEQHSSVMHRISTGDEEAFTMIYEWYAEFVYILTQRIVRDPTISEDLVQDIFIELWKRSDRYDSSRGTVASYLATIARSRAIDHIRRKRRHSAIPLHFADELPAVIDSPIDRTDGEKSIFTSCAFQYLSINERVVMTLSYVNGLSQQAIAQRLGRPLGTIKTWARKGISRLERYLTSKDGRD